MLGRYELITRIGEGGMAEVQLALQRGPAGFEKLVVVKLVHESLATQKDFVDMLLDEARVAALLKHPNVVDIYDLGEDGGRFFIAMEYLEGEPLLAVLRAGRDGKRLDTLSTARLIADAAEGLDAAHELRTMGGDPLELVHHDVSLGNIVVLYNGQVKLVDFGVAKATQSVVTRNRRLQGKFSYMAPEKLRGGAGDRRSDIWSLGCVLWEALTLKRLFKGANDMDTMRQVLESEIPLPSKANPDVMPAFDPIAMRALQRDVDQRYPTAKEMASDLEDLLGAQNYAGKNDRIARYMQATFASHIEARKRLLQEVSSKGRASADVLVAAFDDPAFTSAGLVSGEFSRRARPTTIEVRGPEPSATGSQPPRPGSPTGEQKVRAETAARPDATPSRRVLDPFQQVPFPPLPAGSTAQPIEYPRANQADLPPIVAGYDDGAPTELAQPIDESSGARRRSPTAAAATKPARRTRLRLGLGALAIAAAAGAVVIATRGGGDGDAGAAAKAAETAPAAADPSPDLASAAAAHPVPPESGGAVEPGAAEPAPQGAEPAAGSDADRVPELPPDKIAKPNVKTDKVEKVDPAALYRNGLNAYVLGDLKTALALFKRALAANPGFAIAWRGVGLVHEKLGDKRAATAAFQRYLQLAPNASDAPTIRGKMGPSGKGTK